MIVATVSGPDTYYDYHGQILGYQYLLATHFAQHIGARLRVELCRDTLELMQTLERGDVDIVAYPLTFTDIGKADLVSCGPVNASDSTSWAVRHDTPLLAKALRSWYTPGLGKKLTAEERTQQKERSQVRRKVRARYLSRSQGIISPYDQHFKAAARVTGWDWKLIAAQCYQESGFDPDAVSWAGAQGLMQIMPTTAQHLGLSPNLVHQPAENIAAAARYIRELSESFREVRDGAERIKFVLAAYNGGYFHIRDAMALCRKYGALLVCDEVVTGFRIGLSGAQGYYGIDPDITIFGKIIAGGYPGAGGIGGHKEVMKYLGAGLDKAEGKKIHKAMCGGTMAATPISCCAGYTVICEIEKRNACQVAGHMADRLVKGINESIKKYDLPFVCYNIGSICHLHTVATMHFKVDWKRPWTIPNVLKQTGLRQTEMQYMGAAYMAEGLVTLAGSRLYTSAAYTEEDIDECIRRFDRVLSKCEKIDY